MMLCEEKATIGFFENNESAHRCYKKTGFVDMETVKSEPWNVIEMEIKKKDYMERKNNLCPAQQYL